MYKRIDFTAYIADKMDSLSTALFSNSSELFTYRIDCLTHVIRHQITLLHGLVVLLLVLAGL